MCAIRYTNIAEIKIRRYKREKMHRYNSAKVSLQKQIVSGMNSEKEYFK